MRAALRRVLATAIEDLADVLLAIVDEVTPPKPPRKQRRGRLVVFPEEMPPASTAEPPA
jgi:hypothetical protein